MIIQRHDHYHSSTLSLSCYLTVSHCKYKEGHSLYSFVLAIRRGRYRFRGFSQAYEDVAPSMDHFAFFRLAINLMLLMPVDDAASSMLLFPTWPEYWDVQIKLHGPRNTVVEAACTGGKLDYLRVTPPERTRDVVLVGCKG